MKYELVKDGKRVYITRELDTIKRIMAKEILGLSDRQTFDPAFTPEDYKFNKVYAPFRGVSIILKQIDDGDVDAKPVNDDDDTLPWYIINSTNIDGTSDKPIAQSQKKEKIIKKLHSLNVWIDDFELDKVYESENGIFYKITEQDDKIGSRMVTPHERTFTPKEKHLSDKPQKSNIFVSRRGHTKSVSKKPKNTEIPDVLVKAIEKAAKGSPFFLNQLNVEGYSAYPLRTKRKVDEIGDTIKNTFDKIDYWIFHEGAVSFFRVADKWYHVGVVNYPFGKLFSALVKSEEFSV